MLRTIRKGSQVLGINKRNISYIKPSNSRRAIRIADNKLLTKRVLIQKSIPVAETFDVIKDRKELNTFDWHNLPKSFVLKPNRGLEGRGVAIFYGRIKRKSEQESPVWVKADKTRMTIPIIQNHVLDILDGQFSKGQLADCAIFEHTFRTLRMCIFRINPSLDGYNDTINYKTFQAVPKGAEAFSVMRITLSGTLPAPLFLQIHTSTSH